MNKGKGVAVLLTLLAGLAIAPIAQAEALRTWVSGTGDDANPCSRTAPCKTFAGAISKTAANGEIDAIDPGGYGAVTITKSITIDGRGTMASILVAGTNGINIAGAGINVKIKNLSINGTGTGINAISVSDAKSVRVDNVHMFGFTNRGISWTSSEVGSLFVKNTTVHDCGAKGLYFQGGASAASYLTVTNSSFDNSGGGVGVSGVTAPTVGILTNVTISGNTNPGLSADHNASVF
ncbi:MAG: hypothetical protein QOH95_1587, partial [Gaiellaceae bacterium]|nr:hypothetical protein [Gaiellaceae bacterium]